MKFFISLALMCSYCFVSLDAYMTHTEACFIYAYANVKLILQCATSDPSMKGGADSFDQPFRL